MKSSIKVCVLISILGLTTSCGLADKSTIHSQQTVSPTSIGVESNRPWSTQSVTLTQTPLIALQMVQGKFGRAVDKTGSIYESDDAGKTWRKVSGQLPAATAAHLDFVNQTKGWAVITKPGETRVGGREYDASLWGTNDGGRNWRLQYTVKNGYLNHIQFLNDNTGWAVGSVRESGEDEIERVLILKTNNEGSTWKETFKESSSTLNSDSAQDVFVETDSKVLVLTIAGKILQTEDAGQNWSILQGPETQPQLANLRLLKTMNNNLFVLRSANSRENTVANIARMNPRREWETSSFEGWYIRDLKLLPDGGLIACGFVADGPSVEATTNLEGIVVLSPDEGKTWKIIYKNKEISRIEELAIISAGEFLARTDQGTVIRFTQ